MDCTRRDLIRSIAGIATGLAAAKVVGLPRVLNADTNNTNSVLLAGNPLKIPSTFSGDELVAAVGKREIWPGTETTVWTLGGSYPGPTIRVRRGDTFAVRLRNMLEEDTIVHWHGQIIPHEMDGHPMDAIGPGETFDYQFEILNQPGTYFYHPHPHGRTAPQSYKGMGGLFIVEDEEDTGLPSGEFDIPLIVQDRLARPDNEFTYDPDPTQVLNGFLTDTIMVNGTPDAYLEVSADQYRFRVANLSNARLLKLGFASGKTFHVVGTDGGLLDKPYLVDSVYVGPAERVELLVDFSPEDVGTSLQLMTLNFSGATTYRQQGMEMPVLRFDVTAPGVNPVVLPNGLIPFEPIDPLSAERTRVWAFQTTPLPRDGHHHHINGRVFGMTRADGQVRLGETEIWELRNEHIMVHPVHIHGVQFQVLERVDGVEMAPRDFGWKDTVVVWGHETVRVIVRFAPYKGLYLIHCHNLEHEDEGMMLNYEIGDEVSSVSEGVDNTSLLPTRMDLR